MSHLPHRIKKYKISNTTYTLSHSCDTHYLSKNLKSEISYTLEFRESSLSIKDTKSNKDIAFILTKEIPQLQEKQILLDSKDLQALALVQKWALARVSFMWKIKSFTIYLTP